MKEWATFCAVLAWTIIHLHTAAADADRLPLLSDFVTNCTTNEGIFNIYGISGTTHISSSSYHLACRVSVPAPAPLNSTSVSLSCYGGSSVKVFLGAKSDSPNPKIQCVSTKTIEVQFDYLDGDGSPFYEDSLVHSQYQYENVSSMYRNSISIQPVGRVSTKYTVWGPEAAEDEEKADSIESQRAQGATVSVERMLITILVLYGQGQVQADDISMYSPNPGGPDTPFVAVASKDVIVIPCMNGVTHLSFSVFEVQNDQNQSSTCTAFDLSSPAVMYDPLEGVNFDTTMVPGYANHSYLCCPFESPSELSPTDCSSPLCQRFRIEDPPDFEVTPPMPASGDALHLFGIPGEDLLRQKLECSSLEPVTLRGRLGRRDVDQEGVTPKFVSKLTPSNYTVRRTRTSPRARYKATFIADLKALDSLEVECVNRVTGEVLYSWSVTVHDVGNSDSPQNYLKFILEPIRQPNQKVAPQYPRADGETNAPIFQCYSHLYNDTQLRAIRCENEQQCRLLQWCLKPGSGATPQKCGELIIKGEKCLFDKRSKSCAEVQIPSPGAILLCTADGGAIEYGQIRWLGMNGVNSYRLRELDYRNKTDQLDVIGAIVEGPQLMDRVYYSGIVYNVTCVIHPFWSSGRARFFFGFSNEENLLMSVDALAPVLGEDDRFPGWPYGDTVQLTFPSTLVNRIACSALKRDSDMQWLFGVDPIGVIESVQPEILNDETALVFADDGEQKTIECQTHGQPPPQTKWTIQGGDGSEREVELNPNSTDVYVVDSSILKFARFTKELEATYTCRASSAAGVASMDFHVSLPKLGLSTGAALGVALSAFVLVLALLGAALRRFYFKRRRILDQAEMDEFKYGDTNYLPLVPVSAELEAETSEAQEEAAEGGLQYTTISPNWRSDLERRPFDTRFEISRRKFKIDKSHRLGAGEFGKVYAGTARLDGDGIETTVNVAIKVPKRNCPEQILSGLLKELKIMTGLKHENIVSLVGASTTGAAYGDLYILMEFCDGGSLDKFFERNKTSFVRPEDVRRPTRNPRLTHSAPESVNTFGFKDLLLWCLEVATGLEFLASKAVVHRDIAARNVLLTKSRTAKVSDFGLSRQLYGRPAYEMQTRDLQLPWRSMAIECFEGTFSTSSDVWAFGVLAWEIFSLGEVPFKSIDFRDGLQFVEQLCRGMRLTERHHATPAIFEKMEECWREDPVERPPFTDLKHFFYNLCNSSSREE